MNNENKQNGGRRYIVMDIVFYGSSLNYDKGTGNYQELKKITKWDGKQYTFVSRYALRYSLLKTAENLGLWKNAPGTILERSGERDKTVIQPSIALLSGDLLKYPEFDFFGYLITNTTPQNSREAPVKISHAISMTPYNYDSHFAGNLWYAKRMIEAGKAEKMDPNLFTVEEHQTYYICTVVIDVDRIGKNEVYISKGSDLSLSMDKEENTKNNNEEREKKLNKKSKKVIENIKKEEDKIVITYKDKDNKNNNPETKTIDIPETIDVNIRNHNLDKLFVIEYSLKDLESKRKERIINLINSILNLKRNIKARCEDLQPKLLVLGLYKGKPYQSFKDRIILANEYEEIFEETFEPKNNGVKVIKRVVKLERPTFKIVGKIDQKKVAVLDENEIVGNQGKINDIFNSTNSEVSNVYIFHAPEVKVITEQ